MVMKHGPVTGQGEEGRREEEERPAWIWGEQVSGDEDPVWLKTRHLGSKGTKQKEWWIVVRLETSGGLLKWYGQMPVSLSGSVN
jgi:hypothetical protein